MQNVPVLLIHALVHALIGAVIVAILSVAGLLLMKELAEMILRMSFVNVSVIGALIGVIAGPLVGFLLSQRPKWR